MMDTEKEINFKPCYILKELQYSITSYKYMYRYMYIYILYYIFPLVMNTNIPNNVTF